MPFGSYLVQKNYNPRGIILAGETLALSCFLIAAYMDNFVAFVALYVIGFGS